MLTVPTQLSSTPHFAQLLRDLCEPLALRAKCIYAYTCHSVAAQFAVREPRWSGKQVSKQASSITASSECVRPQRRDRAPPCFIPTAAVQPACGTAACRVGRGSAWCLAMASSLLLGWRSPVGPAMVPAPISDPPWTVSCGQAEWLPRRACGWFTTNGSGL